MHRAPAWIKALVSLAFLAALAWLLPWDAARAAFSRVRPEFLALLVAADLAAHLVSSFKWRMLVRVLGGRLAVIDSLRCYAAGLFGSLCLPGLVGGDVVRMLLARKALGRLEPPLLGGLLDRLLDVSALIALLLGGVAALESPAASPGAPTTLLWAGLLAVAGAALVWILLRRPLASWPVRWRRPVARTLLAMRRARAHPGRLLAAFTLSLLIQGSFILLNSRIGHEIGIEVPLAVWFVVWPLAKLTALVPISLGGLGVRDAAQGALLLGFGIPASQGVVASLVWQAVLLLAGAVAGSTWLWLSLRRRRTRSAAELYRSTFSVSGRADARSRRPRRDH